MSTLGLGQGEAEWLRERIIEAVATSDVVEQSAIPTVGAINHRMMDFVLAREGHAAMVRTCWIIRRNEEVLRLTTCFIL